MKFEDINWLDPKCQITPHFTVKDALWLPSWQVLHQPSEAEKANLFKLMNKMEEIREYLGRPINVHVTLRPLSVNAPGSPYHGRNYNAAIGGAPKSAHTLGLAMDFNPYSMTCDDARAALERELVPMNIRMENKPASNWVHIDLMPPNPNRYFKP